MTFGFGFGFPRSNLSGGFSPASLFAAGEPGAWYDPSDLTTMFQDRAGSTPVTAPGQSVGLRLDKSQGLVLGPELVTNGTFNVDTFGWSAGSGATLSVVSQSLVVTNPAGGTNRRAFQSITCIVGATYKISVTDVAGSLGGRIGIGTSSIATEVFQTSNTVGAFEKIFVATAITMWVGLAVQSSVAGSTSTFDNVSIRELPGNHITAINDASRGTYGIEPLGGRRNLLTFTEQFDNAYWGKTNITLTSGIADPTGSTAAFTFTATAANATVSRSLGFQPAGSPISAFVRRRTGSGAVQMWLGSSYVNITVTDSWARVAPLQVVLTTGFWDMRLTVSGDAVDVAFPQFELGPTVTPYQRVGSTAFDVTQAGVPSLSYVSYDGVDDGYVSPTITPGTDKVQVFAGVRKLSDVARGTVAEMSVSIASNNGAFYLTAPNAASSTFGFESKGTTLTDAVATGIAAPATRVLTGLGDVAGDSTILRVNGTQADADTGDQGTGNFLAYPLYIGRRGGTTLPFNGRDYGIIVRFGTNLSIATIVQTESFLNQKTGAY